MSKSRTNDLVVRSGTDAVGVVSSSSVLLEFMFGVLWSDPAHKNKD